MEFISWISKWNFLWLQTQSGLSWAITIGRWIKWCRAQHERQQVSQFLVCLVKSLFNLHSKSIMRPQSAPRSTQTQTQSFIMRFCCMFTKMLSQRSVCCEQPTPGCWKAMVDGTLNLHKCPSYGASPKVKLSKAQETNNGVRENISVQPWSEHSLNMPLSKEVSESFEVF